MTLTTALCQIPLDLGQNRDGVLSIPSETIQPLPYAIDAHHMAQRIFTLSCSFPRRGSYISLFLWSLGPGKFYLTHVQEIIAEINSILQIYIDKLIPIGTYCLNITTNSIHLYSQKCFNLDNKLYGDPLSVEHLLYATCTKKKQK